MIKNHKNGMSGNKYKRTLGAQIMRPQTASAFYTSPSRFEEQTKPYNKIRVSKKLLENWNEQIQLQLQKASAEKKIQKFNENSMMIE